MPRRLNPSFPTVRIQVSTKSGETVEEMTATTVLVRGGKIRRHKLELGKTTDLFFLQMPEGRHPLFISAPGFFERVEVVDFVHGVNPLLEISLEPARSPSFRPFNKLSERVRSIFTTSAKALGAGSAEGFYRRVGHVKKAAALNILAKMAHTPVDTKQSQRVLDYLSHVYEFRRDRMYVALKTGWESLEGHPQRSAGRPVSFPPGVGGPAQGLSLRQLQDG